MSNVPIRRLTDSGVEKLWAYVGSCQEAQKAGVPLSPMPASLIDDVGDTEDAGLGCQIDRDQKFQNRYEFAEYVCQTLGDAWKDELLNDAGLWAWLAVAFWEQFTAGKVNRQEHYIPIIGKYIGRLGREPIDYRHCVRTPVQLFRRFGKDSRLFLVGSQQHPRSMGEMGDFIEQILSRPDVYGSDRLLEVIKVLYADKNGREKAGCTAAPNKKKLANGRWSRSGRGGIRRLVKGVLPRVKLTYFVNELSPERIVELAGPEFSGAD